MTSLRRSVLKKTPKTIKIGRTSYDFAALGWDNYFDKDSFVTTESGNFHLYSKGTKGPTLFCLHGGGYSGLTWALFAQEVVSNVPCQVMALDLRGHGETTTSDDSNLSLETLAKDVADVLQQVQKENTSPIILVGHSMGGAVAVETVRLVPSLTGLCVIDVVEGTALEALSSMQQILRGRPAGFSSMEQAIQWSFRSGQTKNLVAARISMPGQVMQKYFDEEDAIEETDDYKTIIGTPPIAEVDEHEPEKKFTKPPIPPEHKKEEPKKHSPTRKLSSPPHGKGGGATTSKHQGSGTDSKTIYKYVWRVDLRKTEPYWTGWFNGMSQKFLDLPVPKLLILANINGLDKTLTVAQMQGKFQFHILRKSGHAIHEDLPHDVADIVSTFLLKHKLSEKVEEVVLASTSLNKIV